VGTVSTGQIAVLYSSDPLGNIVDGTVDIVTFSFSGALNMELAPGPATVTGSVSGVLAGGSGGLLTGNAIDFGGTSHTIAYSVLSCAGSGCGAAGIPAGPTSGNLAIPILMPNFSVGAVFSGSLPFSFVFPSRPGFPGQLSDKQVGATLSVSAPESSRQLVPEPSASLLGGLAAALLTAARPRSPRRARSATRPEGPTE